MVARRWMARSPNGVKGPPARGVRRDAERSAEGVATEA